MKKLINIIICITSLSFSSFSVWAQSCASVKFETLESPEHTMMMEPITINGEYVNLDEHFRLLKDGQYELYLSPGLHHVGVSFWNKDKYMKRINKLRTNHAIESYQTNEKNKTGLITLFVAENSKIFIGMENSADGVKAIVKGKQQFNCDVNQADIHHEATLYTAKEQAAFINSKLSNIVKAAYQYTDRSAHANEVHFGDVFGSSTDYDEKAERLLVTHVVQSSFADKLGLKTGDRVLGFGGIKNKQINKTNFNEYLASLKFTMDATITIERNNQKLVLSEQYLPVAVPEYSFNFVSNNEGLNGYVKTANIPEQKLNAYLDAQLLELSHYLMEQKYTGNVYFDVPLTGELSAFHLYLSLESRQKMEDMIAKAGGDIENLQDSNRNFDMNRYKEMFRSKQVRAINQIMGSQN